MSRDVLTTLGVATDSAGAENLLHYRIDKMLGEGGMAVVFAGFDRKLQRDVAIKVLKPEISERADSRSRFVEEARALAAVEHDHVVKIHAVEQHNGLPFIVMERLSGQALSRLLKQKPQLEPIDAITIAQQIARGLHAAHSRRILHRDIKPSNVWIEEGTQRVKLLDFGLAEPLGSPGARFSGTPAYLSPEQARSEPVDQRTDLYSLGVVLSQMLAGKLPFAETNRSAMLVAVVAKEPTPISSVTRGLPEELTGLVDSLLAKKKSDRPENAISVVHSLQRVRERLEETTARKLQRWVVEPTTLLMSASVLIPAIATWLAMNATAQPNAQASSETQSVQTTVDTSRFDTTVTSIKGTLRTSVCDFEEPSFNWDSVVDCALTISRQANELRVLGILGDIGTAVDADRIETLIARKQLVPLDHQSRGEPNWLGRDGQIRSASQELVTFVRESKQPRLLLLIDGKPMDGAADVVLRVEVVNERP